MSKRTSRDAGGSAKKAKTEEEESKEVKSSSEFWLDEQIALINDDNKWKTILEDQAKQARPLFSFIEKLPAIEVLPSRDDVFNAFKLCPFDDVKVVLLGQDPYHGPGQAHGLSFSVQKGVALPPSLKNIYKEMKNDLGDDFTIPKGGDLTPWAKQGVLMLNTLLTVKPATPNAHKKKGWEGFTDSCLKELALRKTNNLVYILWGKPAQEKEKIVGGDVNNLIIKSSHPSPLGANAKNDPFFGSKFASRCNEFLKANGIEEIDWNLE